MTLHFPSESEIEAATKPKLVDWLVDHGIMGTKTAARALSSVELKNRLLTAARERSAMPPSGPPAAPSIAAALALPPPPPVVATGPTLPAPGWVIERSWPHGAHSAAEAHHAALRRRVKNQRKHRRSLSGNPNGNQHGPFVPFNGIRLSMSTTRKSEPILPPRAFDPVTDLPLVGDLGDDMARVAAAARTRR